MKVGGAWGIILCQLVVPQGIVCDPMVLIIRDVHEPDEGDDRVAEAESILSSHGDCMSGPASPGLSDGKMWANPDGKGILGKTAGHASSTVSRTFLGGSGLTDPEMGRLGGIGPPGWGP